MAKRRLLLLAVALIVVAPASLYLTWPAASMKGPEELARLLREAGFNPITPPSNLITVGSIYSVSPDGRYYRTVCEAEPSLLDGKVRESPSTGTTMALLTNRKFDLRAEFDKHVAGAIGAEDVAAVRFSLADVTLAEVSEADNRDIYERLVEAGACKRTIIELLRRRGALVCQGQTVLMAKAEFEAAHNTELGDHGKATAKPVNAPDVDAQSDAAIEGYGSTLISGGLLHYGIKVNSTCFAPPHARFERNPPTTALDRWINFVKFEIIEPVLPATAD